MTRKEKIRQIYLAKPHLVNDDIGLLIYVMNRYGVDLTPDQEQALRRMGNPEHWTRPCRTLREKDPAIIPLVSKKTIDKRHEKFVDYKYNRVYEYAPAEED